MEDVVEVCDCHATVCALLTKHWVRGAGVGWCAREEFSAVEKEEEGGRRAAKEEVVCVEEEVRVWVDLWRDDGGLVAEYIECDGGAERVRDDVHAAALRETGVIVQPETVHAVCFGDYGGNHFCFVVREVVGDVEEDITDEAADGGDGVRGDVLEREHVGGGGGGERVVVEGKVMPPVDGEDHKAGVGAEVGVDGVGAEFDVDVAAEGVHGVGEVEGFDALGDFLSDAGVVSGSLKRENRTHPWITRTRSVTFPRSS